MSRWQNTAFQDSIAASEKEIDTTQRKKLLSAAHSILLEEMPVMPIYFTSIAYGKSENLQGMNVLESCMLDVRHAYFEEKSAR
jgi:oligopeptide transport system substrate-binding protein